MLEKKNEHSKMKTNTARKDLKKWLSENNYVIDMIFRDKKRSEEGFVEYEKTDSTMKNYYLREIKKYDALIELLQICEKICDTSYYGTGRKPTDAELVSKCCELRQQGKSYHQIAKEIGLSVATVHKYVKKSQ